MLTKRKLSSIRKKKADQRQFRKAVAMEPLPPRPRSPDRSVAVLTSNQQVMFAVRRQCAERVAHVMERVERINRECDSAPNETQRQSALRKLHTAQKRIAHLKGEAAKTIAILERRDQIAALPPLPYSKAPPLPY